MDVIDLTSPADPTPRGATYRSTLHDLVRRHADPSTLLDRVTGSVETSIEAADGVMLLSREGPWLRCRAASGRLAHERDRRLSIDASLSGLSMRSAQLVYSPDLVHDPRAHWPDGDHGGRSLACVPLRRDGDVIGVISVISPHVDGFDASALATLWEIAGFAEVALSSFQETSAAAHAILDGLERLAPDAGGTPSGPDRSDPVQVTEFLADTLAPGSVRRIAERRAIDDLLAESAVNMVLQPIVDLGSGAVYAAEALARFTAEPVRSPDRWFDQAHRVGLGIELETFTIRRALGLLPRLPDGARLSVNVSHEMLMTGRLPELIDGLPGGRLMLELTEHLAVADYGPTTEALGRLRELGVSLAIDDVGAGFSSFRHIVELAPECIKLDRLFIDGMLTDPTLRAMARALVQFSREVGATLVVEGIETEQQLDCARGLDIPLGQGYLIARPAAAKALAENYAHVATGS